MFRVVFNWRSQLETIAITLANQKGHKQYSEPINLKKLQVADTKRGKTCANESVVALALVLLLIG